MTKTLCGTATLLAALLLAGPACKRKEAKEVKEVHHAETIEEAPRLSSAVAMGDAKLAPQLISGFYDIEANAWRWSQKQFSVKLAPPARAAEGASLELRFTIPPSTSAKLGTLTLSASVGGSALAPQTYAKAGQYVYERDVAANLLTGDAVRVDFTLDKAIPPGDLDKRELGVVVSNVALAAK